MSSITDTLNTLLMGGANTVTLTDTTEVTLFVANGKVLPALLRFAARISDDLGLKLSDAEGIKEHLLARADDVSFVLKLIADYTNDVYSLAGSMSSVGSKEGIEELPIDDICKIVVGIVAVNRDFFIKRVLPMLLPKEPSKKG